MRLKHTYDELFSEKTKSLYCETWEAVFSSESEIEQTRQQLMKDPYFDIKKAFRSLIVDSYNCVEIAREDLGELLGLDRAHRDILFARFNKRPNSDSISYAEVSLPLFV